MWFKLVRASVGRRARNPAGPGSPLSFSLFIRTHKTKTDKAAMGGGQITGGAGEINNPRGAYEHILSQSEPNWGDKNNPELDDRTWVTTRGDREQTATVTRRLNEDRNIWSENSTASPYLSSPTLSPALQPNNLLEKITKKKKHHTAPRENTHIQSDSRNTRTSLKVNYIFFPPMMRESGLFPFKEAQCGLPLMFSPSPPPFFT